MLSRLYLYAILTMMGQMLSEPVTTKETLISKNQRFYAACSSMQGWRVTMEDAHTVLLEAPNDKKCAFFAVYDGHGGASVARYASRHLHKNIMNQPAYKAGDIRRGIEEGFMKLDNAMRNVESLNEEMAGSTAVVVLIKDDHVYCGNLGDSRAIAFVDETAIPLSTDHKPNLPLEHSRITKAGFYVEHNRVNGNLAVSRALGDFMFKSNRQKSATEQAVSCYPEVGDWELTEDWKFILIACDGIWDVLTTQDVGRFVRTRLDALKRPEDIVEELLDACCAPDGHTGGLGSDNMSAILIVFLKHMPLEYRVALLRPQTPKRNRSRQATGKSGVSNPSTPTETKASTSADKSPEVRQKKQSTQK